MTPGIRALFRPRRLGRRGAAHAEYAFVICASAMFAAVIAAALVPALGKVYSWQEAVAETTHAPFCTGCIDIGSLGVASFGDGLDAGHAQISANGFAVTLTGPSWKTIPFSHVIKPRTVLSFEIETTGTGSLQGIALQKKKSQPDPDRLFQIFGSDEWGLQDYHALDPVPGKTYRVEIPVGEYHPGRIWQIVLVSQGHGNLETTFSKIRIVDHQPGNGNGPNGNGTVDTDPDTDPGNGKNKDK